jgi:hypothetical protein
MATETVWPLFQARRVNNLQGPLLRAYPLAGTAKQSGHNAAQPSLAQLSLVERSKANWVTLFSTRGRPTFCPGPLCVVFAPLVLRFKLPRSPDSTDAPSHGGPAGDLGCALNLCRTGPKPASLPLKAVSLS